MQAATCVDLRPMCDDICEVKCIASDCGAPPGSHHRFFMDKARYDKPSLSEECNTRDRGAMPTEIKIFPSINYFHLTERDCHPVNVPREM